LIADSREEPGGAMRAAEGVIDIPITPTWSDLRACARFDPHRRFHIVTTVLARIGAGALVAGATGAIVWMTEPEQKNLTLITVALMGGLVGIAAYRFAMERAWGRRIVRDLIKNRQPFRLRADGSLLTLDEGRIGRRVRIADIHRLAETKTHLVLFTGGAPFAALPRAAFPTPSEAAAFAGFLHRMIVKASGPAADTGAYTEIRHE
jgi:hypothetical protein